MAFCVSVHSRILINRLWTSWWNAKKRCNGRYEIVSLSQSLIILAGFCLGQMLADDKFPWQILHSKQMQNVHCKVVQIWDFNRELGNLPHTHAFDRSVILDFINSCIGCFVLWLLVLLKSYSPCGHNSQTSQVLCQKLWEGEIVDLLVKWLTIQTIYQSQQVYPFSKLWSLNWFIGDRQSGDWEYKKNVDEWTSEWVPEMLE